MDPDNKTPEQQKSQESNENPTPTRTRVLAWIGVIFMVLLVLGYTYSVATGKIFAF